MKTSNLLVYWKTRTRTPDNGRRTNDGKDGQGRKRRTTMEKTDNNGKDGQTMEKTDNRWKRRTNDGKNGQSMERRKNDGKDGQSMEKTDKRWKRRTNDRDGKDGQTMEKTDAFSHTFELKFWSNFGWCHIYCKLIWSNVDLICIWQNLKYFIYI